MNGVSEERDEIDRAKEEEREKRGRGGSGELEFLPLPHHAVVVPPNRSRSSLLSQEEESTHPWALTDMMEKEKGSSGEEGERGGGRGCWCWRKGNDRARKSLKRSDFRFLTRPGWVDDASTVEVEVLR